MSFERKWLHHDTPDWVETGAIFFITINLSQRDSTSLIDPTTAKALQSAWQFKLEQTHAFPFLLVVMPDHIHLLSSFAEAPGMKATVAAWKRWTARECKIDWQHGFFDHRLRAEESLEEKAHYLRMNPVRANLCPTPSDWPYTYEWER